MNNQEILNKIEELNRRAFKLQSVNKKQALACLQEAQELSLMVVY